MAEKLGGHGGALGQQGSPPRLGPNRDPSLFPKELRVAGLDMHPVGWGACLLAVPPVWAEGLGAQP